MASLEMERSSGEPGAGAGGASAVPLKTMVMKNTKRTLDMFVGQEGAPPPAFMARSVTFFPGCMIHAVQWECVLYHSIPTDWIWVRRAENSTHVSKLRPALHNGVDLPHPSPPPPSPPPAPLLIKIRPPRP